MAIPQTRKARLLEYERNFNSNRRRNANSAHKSRKPFLAIKTILDWVLMGRKSEIYHNCVTSNKLNLQNLDSLSESVERFWELETCVTRPKAELTLLPKSEQKAIKVPKGTVEKMTDNHYSIGFLWREHRPVLLFNRDLAIIRLKSLENKLKKDPEFYKTYKNTMKDYINKGYASKLSLEQLKQTPSHTNYVPHHGVKNVSKLGKVRVVFDAGAKVQSTS